MKNDITSEWSIITEILNKAETITLAICDDQGPYSVPVNFAIDGQKIFFHSGHKGRKMQALKSHPKISFSTSVDHVIKSGDEACKWGFLFKSVVGFGTARILEDQDAKIKALKAIVAHYAKKEYDIDPKAMTATAVVEITINSATARIKE